jgi:hypothetical protein
MHSVEPFLPYLVPSRFDCIDHHQHLCSMSIWLLCRPNQSGNIWRGAHNPLLCGFRIHDAIFLFQIRFSVRRIIIFALVWIILVFIPVKPMFVSEMLSGVLSSLLSTWWRLIVRIWHTFTIWVHPPGSSFAGNGGGKEDLSDNLNAAPPSC